MNKRIDATRKHAEAAFKLRIEAVLKEQAGELALMVLEKGTSPAKIDLAEVMYESMRAAFESGVRAGRKGWGGL